MYNKLLLTYLLTYLLTMGFPWKTCVVYYMEYHGISWYS